MIKLEEVLLKSSFNFSGSNPKDNILIVGNARCGKSYLAEVFIKYLEGEFSLPIYSHEGLLHENEGTETIAFD